jgi:sigma-B regulation protein RsbU (phosphoserine phosphatase)
MATTSIQLFRRRLVQHSLYPRSGLARFTAWIGILYVLFAIAAAVIPNASTWGDIAAGWRSFFGFALFVCGMLLLIRWIRRTLLWRLRNRLIVTYIFIGVIPVVLILTMIGIAGYLLGNQLTTMMVHRDLKAEVQDLDTLNSTVSSVLVSHIESKTSSTPVLPSVSKSVISGRFPDAAVAAFLNGKNIQLPQAHPPAPDLADPSRNISGVLSYNRGFAIRSYKESKTSAGALKVVIVVPISAALLARAVPDLGHVTLYSLEPVRGKNGGVTVKFSGGKENENMNPVPAVAAGPQPVAEHSFDLALLFASVFPTIDWSTGKESAAFVRVNTRPSVLFHRLFTDLGDVGSAILIALGAVAITFALIELVALFIGVRLSNTITGSIAQLYRATQHINRGDLKHRIDVHSSDQLASLEKSFNSMSESLERLLQEQKEKERLQNELAIAQEVQAQLFPRDPRTVKSLELHGVCKPARTVSGDYYDFVGFGEERLGIAVGDISGKGISAALLMATIHSAVRVFELGAMPERHELVAAGAAAVGASANLGGRRWSVAAESMQSPAEVLTLLNRHLYHSTPPEKYATLFLGMYDGPTRTLTYSNGGHLPPFLIHDSGAVRKLEAGGLVIGLFPEIVLEEEEVKLAPGDIFVAFSDGVTEPENEYGEFGEERLLDLVRSNRHLPLVRISDIVLSAVQDWIGEHEQPDDVTLVLARVQ